MTNYFDLPKLINLIALLFVIMLLPIDTPESAADANNHIRAPSLSLSRAQPWLHL